MKSFNRSPKKSFAGEIFEMPLLLWLTVMVCGVVVYLLNYFGLLNPINSSIDFLSITSHRSVYQTSEKFNYFFANLTAVNTLTLKNQDLTTQVTKLNSQLAEENIILNQDQQLQKECKITYSKKYPEIGAEVIGYDSRAIGIAIINKGSHDGIKKGDIAVVEKIAIGIVTITTDNTAQVQLLNNNNSNLPVKLETANLGLLTTASGQLIVQDILSTSSVKVNDKVYTSGLNGTYPPDLYVGEISDIKSDARASTIVAKLSYPLNLNNLQLIMILSI